MCVPDGSVDDLVEQVVVQVGGCRQTQKLHSERSDETQRDSCRTQDDEHRQVEGVAALWVTKKHVSKFWQFQSTNISLNLKNPASEIILYLDLRSLSRSQCDVTTGIVSRAVSMRVIGPDSQPVVDGNNDGVFEEFGGDHQEDHEEATRGQVTPAHLRR